MKKIKLGFFDEKGHELTDVKFSDIEFISPPYTFTVVRNKKTQKYNIITKDNYLLSPKKWFVSIPTLLKPDSKQPIYKVEFENNCVNLVTGDGKFLFKKYQFSTADVIFVAKNYIHIITKNDENLYFTLSGKQLKTTNVTNFNSHILLSTNEEYFVVQNKIGNIYIFNIITGELINFFEPSNLPDYPIPKFDTVTYDENYIKLNSSKSGRTVLFNLKNDIFIVDFDNCKTYCSAHNGMFLYYSDKTKSYGMYDFNLSRAVCPTRYIRFEFIPFKELLSENILKVSNYYAAAFCGNHTILVSLTSGKQTATFNKNYSIEAISNVFPNLVYISKQDINHNKLYNIWDIEKEIFILDNWYSDIEGFKEYDSYFAAKVIDEKLGSNYLTRSGEFMNTIWSK